MLKYTKLSLSMTDLCLMYLLFYVVIYAFNAGIRYNEPDVNTVAVFLLENLTAIYSNNFVTSI